MSIRLLTGDCRDVMRTLADESVHCVVTSPPYWGLRDYGVVGQIGLEPTLNQFVAEMVAVFREVRRVLRKDGTLWLNLGDTYATGTSSGRKPTSTAEHGYWENPSIAFRINGAGDGLIIVSHLGGGSGCRKDPSDHVAAVEAAHAGDHRIEVARLPPQVALGEVGEVEPYGRRQAEQEQNDDEGQDQAARVHVFCKIGFHGSPSMGSMARRIAAQRSSNSRRGRTNAGSIIC